MPKPARGGASNKDQQLLQEDTEGHGWGVMSKKEQKPPAALELVGSWHRRGHREGILAGGQVWGW